jgi:hypothetical protein
MVPSVGKPPGRAYLVSVPATDLDLGFEMSAATRAAAVDGVASVVDLLTSPV